MGHTRRRGRTARVGAAVAVAALVAGCSTGSPPDDEPPPAESAALRVETVSGAERLDEQTRTEVEEAVGKVLSDYLLGAFLGDFPRQEFVQSFEDFTSGAALKAAGRDIDRLTAAKVRDATAVRATELDARLSFLTQAGEVHGGSATVHFAFEATMEDGSTRPLVLDGRFLLDADNDRWSIFGYDVRLDDGGGTDAEAESGGGS